VTAAREWLAAREPKAPADLAERMTEQAAAACSESDIPGEVAMAAATEELRRALERPGRVRASALSLLVADAWITCACEAALEADDPVTGLRAMTERIGRLR